MYRALNYEIIDIDRKTARGSRCKSKDKLAIHTVTAWASEHQIVLGQLKVDDKSNEITAIPLLLDTLLGRVDLCCTHFAQQYIGSHINTNASDTMLA